MKSSRRTRRSRSKKFKGGSGINHVLSPAPVGASTMLLSKMPSKRMNRQKPFIPPMPDGLLAPPLGMTSGPHLS